MSNLRLNYYLATGYMTFMKSMLSERNFAAILFVMVLIAFSFAHEDSKKRDVFYNTSTISTPSIITSAPGVLSTKVVVFNAEKSHP